jgi:hypothetical protein
MCHRNPRFFNVDLTHIVFYLTNSSFFSNEKIIEYQLHFFARFDCYHSYPEHDETQSQAAGQIPALHEIRHHAGLCCCGPTVESLTEIPGCGPENGADRNGPQGRASTGRSLFSAGQIAWRGGNNLLAKKYYLKSL